MTTLNDVHLVGMTSDGALLHTIRFASGSWQANWGNVNAQVGGNIVPSIAIGCAVNAVGDLHIVTATHDIGKAAQIWHTIRFASGSWQANWGNVNAQETNNPAPNVAKCAVSTAGDLHVVGIDTNWVPWHTIRFASGSWQANWGNVNAQGTYNPPPIVDTISCATNAAGDLHLLALVKGIPWHTIRFASGSWQAAWDNVNTAIPGNTVSFTGICCTTNAAGDLHAFALDPNGAIWHTIRFASGSWQSVWDQVIAPGPLAFLSAAS